MAGRSEILTEIQSEIVSNPNTGLDVVRRKYISEFSTYVDRNVIAYYSGFLQIQNQHPSLSINDDDINGFMNAIHGMDKSKGLDLILHTPGGNAAATEAIISYLKSCFGNDIRVFVPQIAMSGGTIIACSAKEIFMGKHSSLGPVDVQIGSVSAGGIIEDLELAQTQIAEDDSYIHIRRPILEKYPLGYIKDAMRVKKRIEETVESLLETGMFNSLGNDERTSLVKGIVSELSDVKKTKTHGRHFNFDKCKDIGLKVVSLESDDVMQDKLLSIHHSMMVTLSSGGVTKIIENHLGKAYVITAR